MAKSRLVSINPKEVQVGEPLPFAIYDRAGNHMLAAGEAITSQKQLDWLIESGLMASLEVTEQEPPISIAESAFGKLQLVPGIPMQLEQAGTPPRRVACHLVGYEPGIGILVAVNRRVSPFLESEGIAVRLAHGNSIILFQSKVLRPALPGLPMLVIQFPEQVRIQQFRRHTRLDTGLDARFTNQSLGHAQTTACQIMDISAGGARILAPAQAAEEGHVLQLDLQLPGKSAQQLTASVLSAKPQDSNQTEFKCAFTGLAPNDRILIEHFVLTESAAHRCPQPGATQTHP